MLKFDISLVNAAGIKRYLRNVEAFLNKRILATKHETGRELVKKARSYAPIDSGQLRKDITYKIKGNEIQIHVPRGANSGGYADIMHNTKYELGKQSKRKGSRVGPKFIKRAINNEEGNIIEAFGKVFRRL